MICLYYSKIFRILLKIKIIEKSEIRVFLEFRNTSKPKSVQKILNEDKTHFVVKTTPKACQPMTALNPTPHSSPKRHVSF